MGSTPTSVTDNTIPWSNGDDTCVTCRRRWFNSIRDHSTGLPVFWQHTAVVRRKTGFNSRADLCKWACMLMEATDPCKIGAMGSTPIRSTDNKMGLMVQREDTAMAWRPVFNLNRAGSIPGGSTEQFDFVRLRRNEEGSRIRLAGPVC